MGKDPEQLVEVLRKTIVLFKVVKELILVDKGFDKSIIRLIKGKAGNKIEKIIL